MPSENTEMTGKQIKHKLSAFKHGSNFSKPQLVIFVIAFALIGYLIFRSFAAAPVVATLEGEQMILPAGGSIVADSTASAGKAVKLAQNGMATASVNFASSVSSFTLSARGDQCSGAPAMSVAVDGNNLLTNTAVSSTSWASYTYTLGTNVGSGNHSFSVAFTNDYVNAGKVHGNSGKSTGACDRNLYIDVTTYYGPVAVTNPTPTVSLSASPVSVTAGIASTLTWASANATSCTASGAWSGTQPTSGSVSTGALNKDSTYALTCTGAGGSASASATVAVTAAPTANGSSIYWGAYIEGQQTYSYYYGGTWGNTPWDSNTWNKFESNAGKKVSLLHWGQPQPWSQTTFYTGTADYAYNRGALNMIDYGQSGTDNLSTMVNGGYDSAIKTWAANVKAYGKPFLMRPWWEMNGQWYSWGKDAAANPSLYVNAWRHYHDVVTAAGATNVTWVWCPNTEFSGSTPLASLYPGDAYVDWTCMDGYNKSTSTYWLSFNQLFGQTYKDISAIAPTKPMLIGETGSNEVGGSKSSWITDAFSTQLPQNYPNIKAVMWFNWRNFDDGGATWNAWPIESSSTSTSAFKMSISSSYYAPGSSTITNLPILTKVNPLP
jgi:hypothetical protein